jgi:DNA-binding transcriptional MerR regulator
MLIGELAARTGTTAKALRFYEQAGVLPEPARTSAGYRDYDRRRWTGSRSSAPRKPPD